MAKQVDSTNIGGLLEDLITRIKNAFWRKSDTSQLSIDNSPTSGSNNLVKSGGVYTALSAKYEKPSGGIPASDIASGVIPTVPTISTDIQTDKTSTTKTAAPSAVYNEVHPTVQSSQPNDGMLPNVLYNLGTLSGSVTISFATPADANIDNEYKFTFDTDTTAPTITWPNSITAWAGNCLDSSTPPVPTIASSKHYEVSVLGGYAFIVEV